MSFVIPCLTITGGSVRLRLIGIRSLVSQPPDPPINSPTNLGNHRTGNIDMKLFSPSQLNFSTYFRYVKFENHPGRRKTVNLLSIY